jgi:tetratricopeptide (TPR) repeat protein
MMRRTVVVVDMVGYSDIAKLLEENISAGSVAELNRQIQAFISRAVKELGDPEACCLMARTGDGAILLFERAGDAHSFAISVQMQARRHNQSRSEVTAKRRFRIGIATGDVSKSPGQGSPDEYAGIAIANAKRLESAARASEIVTDTETFAELPPEARSLYRGAEVVRGKRKESFRAHRCILPEAASEPVPASPRLTRRRLLAGSAVLAASAAAIWRPESVLSYFATPLPKKRFVVLLNWPQVAGEVSNIVSHALRSIESELSKVEAVDKDFFITHGEPNAQSSGQPRFSDLMSDLGTNLVLTVSGRMHEGNVHLPMRVVDADSGRTLREKEIVRPLGERLTLADKAVETAAVLLDVSAERKPRSESGAGTTSVEALASFQAAEAFRDQLNDTGLEQAIEKYKDAVEKDPGFALAYARLAMAYCRVSEMQHDPGALALARKNLDRAQNLQPDLLQVHLVAASVSEMTGDPEGALLEYGKALSIDPINNRTLVWQGDTYVRLERWPEAERTFQRAIEAHPNNWYGYNELGVAFAKQGKYKEALAQYRMASACQPRNALVWIGIGDACLQMGNLDPAEEAFRKSFELKESGLAAINMALTLHDKGQDARALEFALRAVQLNPSSSVNWLLLGDCYATGNREKKPATDAYSRAADLAQDDVELDPADGPSWMVLALSSAKAGRTQRAAVCLEKADALHASDLDSRLYKLRLLAVLGRRVEALHLVQECLQHGVTRFQLDTLPDTATIRSEPDYRKLLASS